MKQRSVCSMTGFSSTEQLHNGSSIRLELKALNHRFLDIRVRMPREFSGAEMALRGAIQKRFSRGSIDVKLEKLASSASENAKPAIEADLSLAENYHQLLLGIQKRLGLNESIRAMDIASFPDVIRRGSESLPAAEAWSVLEPLIQEGVEKLAQMREHEGKALAKVLHSDMEEMERCLKFLRERRQECQQGYQKKITERIQAVFESNPFPEGAVGETAARALIESRISQELALILDKSDIEEELNRFDGHIAHFRKILSDGGAVGRKLDFILQEMHREINTLGNKAQDLPVSEQVVQLKVKLEQLREQVMNLE